MKWPRWLPRLATEPVTQFESRRDVRVPTPVPADRLGIRDVGNCEVCGRSMQARTRREEFRGRVDCDCGARNHVEYREVRSGGGTQHRHVTVTSGRRFEAATHKPDLRLGWRYRHLPQLLDVRATARRARDRPRRRHRHSRDHRVLLQFVSRARRCAAGSPGRAMTEVRWSTRCISSFHLESADEHRLLGFVRLLSPRVSRHPSTVCGSSSRRSGRSAT